MNQNFYFLRQLSSFLRPQIVGLKFMECFSQERDELVIVLAQARTKHSFYKPFFIRASLRADFACLNFPDSFSRARQNSADLFENLADLSVIGLRQFNNERAFGIELEGSFMIVFKLFGNRSNVVLFQDNTIVDIFNNKLIGDNNLTINTLDRDIDQSWEAFEAAQFDHRKLFPTFGKALNAYIEPLLKTAADNPQKRWRIIEELLQKLNQPTYYLSTWNYQPTLALVPIGEIRATFTDPLLAINDFYNSYLKINVLDKEKGETLRLLQKRAQRTQTYIDETFEKLAKMDDGPKNEELGHILMANLHQIPDRIDKIELFDFYREQPVVIKLKPELNPQKNAENYYRKSKNERIEIEKLNENIGLREQELLTLQQHLTTIEHIETVRELRKYLKNNHIQADNTPPSVAQLFKQIVYEGFVILIGKNAKNNDLLTKHHTYKEDLWLHARDVAGSHVVVKYKAGQRFPSHVIERAAQLAAYYSKRRTDTLCPVIVTPKKFVRKPKGLPDGEVIVEKEEVILVEPNGPVSQ
jgi:predicted ribosome quality control (RQC) complex YloA/Tae2 family protein